MDDNPYQPPKTVFGIARNTHQFLFQRAVFVTLGVLLIVLSLTAIFVAVFEARKTTFGLLAVFGSLGLLGTSVAAHGMVRSELSLRLILVSLSIIILVVIAAI